MISDVGVAAAVQVFLWRGYVRDEDEGFRFGISEARAFR